MYSCACEMGDKGKFVVMCGVHHLMVKWAIEGERERCAEIADAGKCACDDKYCYEVVCAIAGIAKSIRGIA